MGGAGPSLPGATQSTGWSTQPPLWLPHTYLFVTSWVLNCGSTVGRKYPVSVEEPGSRRNLQETVTHSHQRRACGKKSSDQSASGFPIGPATFYHTNYQKKSFSSMMSMFPNETVILILNTNPALLFYSPNKNVFTAQQCLLLPIFWSAHPWQAGAHSATKTRFVPDSNRPGHKEMDKTHSCETPYLFSDLE